MHVFRARWTRWVAVLVVLLAIGWAIEHVAVVAGKSAAQVIYKSQYESCLRGNKLRANLNSEVPGNSTIKGAVVTFAAAAKAARLASYGQTHEKSDLVAARIYNEVATNVAKVHYVAVPQINCRRAVTKP